MLLHVTIQASPSHVPVSISTSKVSMKSGSISSTSSRISIDAYESTERSIATHNNSGLPLVHGLSYMCNNTFNGFEIFVHTEKGLFGSLDST